MPFKFGGVATDPSNNYYYDLNDVKTISVPLSTTCSGDIQMSHDKIKEFFGISESTLPKLPAYYISPRLNSTWGAYYSGNSGPGWIRDFPKDALETQIKSTRTETTTMKLYAGAEFALELSGGGSYMGMKAEAKAKTSTSVEWEKRIVNIDEIVKKGILGKEPLIELALGLMLRAEEAYTHTIDIWVDDQGNNGLYIQALPVFEKANGNENEKDKKEQKEIKDLHIALSNVGWGDWYAYTTGKKGKGLGGQQLVAYPNYCPSTTLMSLISNFGAAEK
ncbi:hypothetical protein FGRMN_6531 [Fusarium graminum]|nr:hypothetical protein FGRMN_6531 [Fusarium graminum]